jgi:hypothetical protein
MIYNFPNKKVEKDDVPAEIVTAEMVGKFIGIYLLGPLFFMLAWNYVVPYLFAVNGINYLHAFCIIFMVKLIQND